MMPVLPPDWPLSGSDNYSNGRSKRVNESTKRSSFTGPLGASRYKRRDPKPATKPRLKEEGLRNCNRREASQLWNDSEMIMGHPDSELVVDFEARLENPSFLEDEKFEQKYNISSTSTQPPVGNEQQQHQLDDCSHPDRPISYVKSEQDNEHQAHVSSRSGIKTRSGNTYGNRRNSKTRLKVPKKTFSSRRTFTCYTCGKKFSRKSQMPKHMLLHLERKGEKELSFSGHICDKVHNRKSKLTDHLIEHTDNEPFSCGICRKKFNRRSHANRHMMLHTGNQLLPSEARAKKTRIKTATKPRNNARHRQRETSFFCDFCADEFATKTILRFHIKDHMDPKPQHTIFERPSTTSTNEKRLMRTSEKSSAGEVCTEGVKSAEGPEDTMPRKEETLSCKNCNDSSSLKNTSKHSRSRSNATTFTCDTCHKSFKCKSVLTKHIWKVHESWIPFPCATCGKTFKSITTFVNHSKTHAQQKSHSRKVCGKNCLEPSHLKKRAIMQEPGMPFSCDTCGKRFRLESTLKSHSFTHTKARPLACKECHLEFEHKRALREHTKKVHSPLNHTCEICNEVFNRKDTLKVHKKKAHLIGNYALCEVCGKICENKATLKRHMNAAHIGEKIYECDDCGKHFSTKGNVQVHIAAVHEARTLYPCEICGKSLKCEASLEIHIRLHMGEKRFSCKVCGDKFAYAPGLRRHLKTHIGTKDFSCNVCGKRFNEKLPFEGHLRTHTGEKPFKCEVCDDKFAQKRYMKRHMKSHSKEYVNCDVCKKNFKTEQTLARHKLRCKRENRRPCNMCDKSFHSKQGLLRHKAMHTGEKRFECLPCGARFWSKRELGGHMLRHTGDWPYSCKICGQKFRKKGRFTTHALKHKSKKYFYCDLCQEEFSLKKILEVHIRLYHAEDIFPSETYNDRAELETCGTKDIMQTEKHEKSNIDAATLNP